MSEYIINDEWIREYERNIEKLIGCDLNYDGYNNPVPPLRKVNTKSRWAELFGTPERAARTLLRVDSSCSNSEVNGIKQSCVTCPLNMNGLEYPKMRCYAYVNEDYDALLEWLRGEGE